MLTGPENSSFYADGLRYKEILSRHGVTVHLVETSGSRENLAQLSQAEVPTAAYLWGIPDSETRDEPTPEGVQSLGTISLQPLWVFTGKDADLSDLQDLSGLRINVGEAGSDSRLLALFLLREEGVDKEAALNKDETLTREEALEAIQGNQVGAIIAVGEPDSPLIDKLLRSPWLQVLSIRRAEAFAARFQALQSVRFVEGAHDLRANIPDHDLQLLAARAQLAVSDLFPPALADLLLQAAREIHGKATPFSTRGEFPNPETAALPLNRAADNFYTNGPAKLQRYLPFRLANWINRFLTAVVALASAAAAIFKLLPALIKLPFKRSLRHAYRELAAVERLAATGADQKTVLDALAKVDQSTAAIKAPLRSLDIVWLELRQYIHDMRDRLLAP